MIVIRLVIPNVPPIINLMRVAAMLLSHSLLVLFPDLHEVVQSLISVMSMMVHEADKEVEMLVQLLQQYIAQGEDSVVTMIEHNYSKVAELLAIRL